MRARGKNDQLTRQLLSEAEGREIEGLLNALDDSAADNSLLFDRLRKYILDDNRFNKGMPLQDGNPPVAYYLLQSSRGRDFLRANPSVLDTISEDAMNYVHHNGLSVLGELVIWPKCRELLARPEVLKKVDYNLYNAPRDSDHLRPSYAVVMLTKASGVIQKDSWQFARLTSERAFAEGFPTLFKMKSDLLASSKDFRDKITENLLSRYLFEIIESNSGIRFLAEHPDVRKRISADALNGVYNEEAAPIDVLINSVHGRALLVADLELAGKISAESVNANLHTLLHEGIDVLLAAPDLVNMINSERVQELLNKDNGWLARYLLTSEKGQQLLAAHPALCHTIPDRCIEGAVYQRGQYHLPWDHPYVYTATRRDYLYGYTAFDILKTKHGRQFLTECHHIRRRIPRDTLRHKIQIGEHKGQRAADFLKLPECKQLQVLFEDDNKRQILAESRAGTLQKLKDMSQDLPKKIQRHAGETDYQPLVDDQVSGEESVSKSSFLSRLNFFRRDRDDVSSEDKEFEYGNYTL